MNNVKSKISYILSKSIELKLHESDDTVMYVHSNKQEIFSVGVIQIDQDIHSVSMLDYTYMKNDFNKETDVFVALKIKNSDLTQKEFINELYNMFLQDYATMFLSINTSKSNDYCFDYKQCRVSLSDLSK